MKKISYDFDGVLHVSVKGLDPIEFFDHNQWEPFTEMHDQLREDSKTHEIIVVTARHPMTNDNVWDFIRKHDLPISKVYATNNMSKIPILKMVGAVRHYDDNRFIATALSDNAIEFIHVDPVMRIMEKM